MYELAVNGARSDVATFDDLVVPHLDAAYRTACAILRDHEEAHDAVQEAALKAFRKLGQLKDGRSARPWFLAIVSRQCLNIRRARWWSVVRVPEIQRAADEVTADSAEIQLALARLPEEDRLALFLHFYLDLPLDEVGIVMGLSPAGAKTRVYRAVRKLRPGLEVQL